MKLTKNQFDKIWEIVKDFGKDEGHKYLMCMGGLSHELRREFFEDYGHILGFGWEDIDHEAPSD